MAIIGITDSGLGGLSVLNSMYRINDRHSYIYLADNLNSPYGIKSQSKIIELTENCVNYLKGKGADIIVLACNTATSAAVDYLRSVNHIEIVGTEPAIFPALKDKHRKILVLATPFTINSERYIRLTEKYSDRIVNCPCRDLARLIDDTAPDFNKLYDYMESILKPFRDCTGIVLGCTHYVLLKDIIHRIIPSAMIYDSSEGIAKRVNFLLNKHRIFSEDTHYNISFIFTGKDEEKLYRDVINNILFR